VQRKFANVRSRRKLSPLVDSPTPAEYHAPRMTLKKRVIGTAGHIDHGKTSLVRALTGIDTDRLPEEKRRGITIDLGFASWVTDRYQIGFVDVPGHERFVKNMLAGIGGIDSVLLVVAADESIKPQTREHFAICRLLGIPTGVIAITKSDLVDREILELVRLEIEELVAGSFLHDKPIVPVSSTTGAGLDKLRAAIIESIDSVSDRDATTRVFRLPIDRVFTMKGFGSVITGTTYAGRVRVDDEVEVLPGGLRSRARGIQVHGDSRDEASAGERTSMNLADVALDDLHRGQQVVHPSTLRSSQIITVRVDLLRDAKPLREQTRVRFHHLSAELLGSIRFIDDTGNELQPGQSAYAQVRLEKPVVAVAGDRFVIRRYSPAFTIGGGVVIDAHLPKLSRGTRVELLDTLADGTLAQRVELTARLQGLRGLSLDEVQTRTGIRIETLTKDLRAVPNVVKTGTTLLHRDVLADFRRHAMTFLDDYFKSNKMAVNVPKGEFVQKLIPPGAPVNFLLHDLASEKIAVVQGDALDIPGRSKTLGGAEGELARAIEEKFREAGLQTPAVSVIIKAIPQRPKVIEGVIGFLVKQGTLIRLAEGVYLHRDVVEQSAAKLASERKGQTIDVGEFKDFFEISRKVAIPLLEYFDQAGVTKRIGDSRHVL
jgi:selenocysteine-specific elongation factor